MVGKWLIILLLLAGCQAKPLESDEWVSPSLTLNPNAPDVRIEAGQTFTATQDGHFLSDKLYNEAAKLLEDYYKLLMSLRGTKVVQWSSSDAYTGAKSRPSAYTGGSSGAKSGSRTFLD